MASKGGRPAAITRETAQKIFELMAEGKSLRQISKLPDMPGKSTILRAAVSTSEDMVWFRDQYAQAISVRTYGLIDDIIDIADDGSNDWYDTEIATGVVVTKPDSEHINRSRLRIDTRKWAASKLLPKVFGERMELVGKDDTPLIPVINFGKK